MFDKGFKIAYLLLFFLLCNVAIIRAQELVIYAIPAPKTLNWKSPHTLMCCYLGNLFRKKYGGKVHVMGHIVVELKDGEYDEIFGEVSFSKIVLFDNVLRKGLGMGILFAKIPGKMEQKNKNYREIQARLSNGHIAYIKYCISKSTFNRLLLYLNEYKQKGYDKIYNGKNKPREGEGAGCAAFGISFVEVAGFLTTEEKQKWMISANIPEKLIGGIDVGNNVSFFKVIFKKEWADTLKEKYQKFENYDPTLVYKWILNKWDEGDKFTSDYNIDNKQKAKGIIYNYNNIPTPTDSIWENDH